MYFKDIFTKKYADGSVGDYFCICVYCRRQFIGHKRDYVCGSSDCEEASDEKLD